MLAILLAPLVVLGPLLQGAWELWARSLLELAALAAALLWLCRRIAGGSVPLPAGGLLSWTVGLALLSAAAAGVSPLPAYAWPSWFAGMAGLGTILAASMMPSEQRGQFERAIRAAAWLTALLAVYQHQAFGHSQPASSLVNENAFAGALLLFLALAASGGDWLLCGLLILCLAWTRSAGAWLGLAASLLLLRRPGWAWRALTAGAGAAALAIIVLKWGSHDVWSRWLWWQSAARMAWAHPCSGFGPGTFAYVSAAYINPSRPLGSLYAHQYYLETAAEQGIPFLAVWLGGIVFLLRRQDRGLKHVGLIAVLVQSLWDCSLSFPAIFWLFCYGLGSSLVSQQRVVCVPVRWKLPALALAVGLCGWAGWKVFSPWQAERLRIRAAEMVLASQPLTAAQAVLERSSQLCDHPETARLSGEIELIQAHRGGGGSRLWSAAADFEHAVAGNPYRASTWLLLENAYQELGRDDLAQDARRRAAATSPGFKGS